MKNCGRRFHNEVGKFRFLNELIKVVSPKVSGSFLISRNFFCVSPSPILLAFTTQHLHGPEILCVLSIES